MKTLAFGVAILMLGTTGVAFAEQDAHHRNWDHDGDGRSSKRSTTVQAPEIDPTSMVVALTLLGGGLAVLRGRVSKKSKD